MLLQRFIILKACILSKHDAPPVIINGNFVQICSTHKGKCTFKSAFVRWYIAPCWEAYTGEESVDMLQLALLQFEVCHYKCLKEKGIWCSSSTQNFDKVHVRNVQRKFEERWKKWFGVWARLTIQWEPVVLSRGQWGKRTGLVLKNHRVGDDLIANGHLERHQTCVMSWWPRAHV